MRYQNQQARVLPKLKKLAADALPHSRDDSRCLDDGLDTNEAAQLEKVHELYEKNCARIDFIVTELIADFVFHHAVKNQCCRKV
jgi:hypothetical protein